MTTPPTSGWTANAAIRGSCRRREDEHDASQVLAAGGHPRLGCSVPYCGSSGVGLGFQSIQEVAFFPNLFGTSCVHFNTRGDWSPLPVNRGRHDPSYEP